MVTTIKTYNPNTGNNTTPEIVVVPTSIVSPNAYSKGTYVICEGFILEDTLYNVITLTDPLSLDEVDDCVACLVARNSSVLIHYITN
jgi:hypothetical protein